MRCLKSQSFLLLESSSYSDLVDSTITTNFHTYIIISHLYIHYDICITTNKTVNRHWCSDTNVYLQAQSLYESFQGKIIHAENDWIFIVVNFYYGYQVYNNRRRYRQRQAMTDDCLAFIHRRPIYWAFIQILPIYEREIGQAAGSLISHPS